VRGNASEILSLAGKTAATRGVDSGAAPETSLDVAKSFAKKYGGAICVSGPTDYICSEEGVTAVRNGHPMMARVTGMGCAATALIGAFLAVQKSPHLATSHAMALCGICGEIAAAKNPGPGSFQAAFLDALYGVTQDDVRARLKEENVA